ncbi:MAG: Adenosylcobinamide-phosphate synthase, partial [uncultured Blastococcus sp.]
GHPFRGRPRPRRRRRPAAGRSASRPSRGRFRRRGRRSRAAGVEGLTGRRCLLRGRAGRRRVGAGRAAGPRYPATPCCATAHDRGDDLDGHRRHLPGPGRRPHARRAGHRRRPCRPGGPAGAGRSRPQHPRAGGAGKGRGRVGRGEHVRRGRRTAVLGGGRRTAGAAGLPRGEHAGRDGRPPLPPLRALRLGRGAAGRPRQLAARPAHRRTDRRLRATRRRLRGRGAADLAAGRRRPPQSQRGQVRSRHGRCARDPAGRAQRLRLPRGDPPDPRRRPATGDRGHPFGRAPVARGLGSRRAPAGGHPAGPARRAVM